MEDIFNLMEKCDIQVTYTFREGNKLADFIKKTSAQADNRQAFINFQILPTMAKKI